MCLYPNRVFYTHPKNNEKRTTVFTSRHTDFMYRYSSMDSWHPVSHIPGKHEIADLRSRGAQVITEYDDVPCGQCIECRLAYARSWSCRVMNEVEQYPENTCWFVTCTYNDDFLPAAKPVMRIDAETGEYVMVPSEFHSLDLTHHQKFMKNLRKEFANRSNLKIKFFMSGEYGELNMRPHFHYILFGVPLDDLRFYKITSNGDKLYTSPTLQRIWNITGRNEHKERGFVTVGDVTTNSAGYIARYCIKKRKKVDEDFYKAYNLKPEFICMSRRPGIGKEWFEKHKNEIYASDSIVLADRNGVKVVKPPKYYDELLRQYNMDQLDAIKDNRKKMAVLNDQLFEHLHPFQDKEVIAEAKERNYMKRPAVIKPRNLEVKNER